MKTGLDVIKAAILGAESFGFGTGPMIAMGCKYLRICHLNNCATGVATQREDLINHHFIGEKEKLFVEIGYNHIINDSVVNNSIQKVNTSNNFSINSELGSHEVVNKEYPYQTIDSGLFYKKVLNQLKQNKNIQFFKNADQLNLILDLFPILFNSFGHSFKDKEFFL